jgi:hypothetical protein
MAKHINDQVIVSLSAEITAKNLIFREKHLLSMHIMSQKQSPDLILDQLMIN